MARTVRDAKIETRAARDRLKASETTHWRTLVPGQLHIGYRRRRAATPGTWIARRYVGLDAQGVGRYRKETLGVADDYQDADGRGVLSFADAQRMAYEVADRADAPARPDVPTVRVALEDYVRFLRAERKTADDAERRAQVHILPELGDLRVDALTLSRLEKWRDDMLALPARLRTGRDREGNQKPQRYRPAPSTPDEVRARKATVNRTITILKAALNRVLRQHPDTDDRAWRLLEPFGKVHAARPGHLSAAEALRLINAADAESGFRDLVQAALLTGCRYGELCRMRVGDFARGRVTVRESKSGKPRDVVLSDEGAAFFAAATAGRSADELMFRRADGTAWAKSHQARPMTAACAAARIAPAIGFHQLRHTWASLAVMGGMPLMLVADCLGHADTRMVERHYGHLADDFRDRTIREHAPRFGLTIAPAPASLDDARRGRVA